MKLALYVSKLAAMRVLAALVVLLSVLQLLDLLDVTNDILDRGLGAGGLAYYAILRLPRMIDQAMPLAVLAGCLFAFAQLGRESAAVAMRAAGVSVYRIAGMAIPVAMGAFILQLAATEVIGPRTDAMLRAWWRDTAPAADRKGPEVRSFRIGPDLVTATMGDDQGRRLDKVIIYRRDASGAVTERVQAPQATYGAGGWTLISPSFERFTDAAAQPGSAARMAWNNPLHPGDVQVLFATDNNGSASSARRALMGGGSERPESYYVARWNRAFAAPAGAFVMLILAAPLIAANFRSGQGATIMTVSLMSGMAFMVMDGMITALGESGVIWPWFGAWSAPLMFSALGAAVLLTLEG
ncbi:LptF/LptG family permease [Caulobacter segnis]|uniref:LptF/LptG family permease n=1 Tax=Caulobacter segnis TaxID=88688 RepID=UPI00240F0087|nr:LptF/LptG family permease [Caulobacter segnis]MDG2523676.1 LptF/LptG family permease [Caulobacter segnis]